MCTRESHKAVLLSLSGWGSVPSWKITAPYINLSFMLSVCQQLSTLVEIWRNYCKNNLTQFFATRYSSSGARRWRIVVVVASVSEWCHTASTDSSCPWSAVGRDKVAGGPRPGRRSTAAARQCSPEGRRVRLSRWRPGEVDCRPAACTSGCVSTASAAAALRARQRHSTPANSHAPHKPAYCTVSWMTSKVYYSGAADK